jgi:hypothetical protein
MLDFLNGRAKFEDAEVKGEITANEGTLGTLTMQSDGYIELPPTFASRKGRLDNTGLKLIYHGASSQTIEWYNFLGTFAGQIAPDSAGHLNLRSDFGVQIQAPIVKMQAPIVRVGTDIFSDVLIGNGIGTVGFEWSHLQNISRISDLGRLTLAYITVDIANDTTLQVSTDVSLVIITSVGSNAGISHIFRTPGTTAPSSGDVIYIVNYSDNHITFRNDNLGNSNIRNQNGPGQWKLYKQSNATLIFYGGYWHVHADASQT